jgi:two-component system, response regulator PdtaR
MRVLIVEDQPAIAESLADALEDAGHDVMGPAYRSDEAVSLAADMRPTLAFVDIDLEASGAGLAVARELDRLGTAVIFATGQSDTARQSAYGLGVIAKPFRPSDVARSIPVVEAIIAGRTPPPPTIPAALQLFSAPRHGELLASGKR